MGRALPVEDMGSVHLAISFSLLLASVAALIAISAGMCGLLFWRKPPPAEEATTTAEDDKAASSSAEEQMTTKITGLTDDDDILNRPLPPPPGVASLELGDNPLNKKKRRPNIDKSSSLCNYMSKSTSKKILGASISMKIPGGKHVKQFEHKVVKLEHKVVDEIAHKKPKDEDSLWRKRILKGEKCRALNRDEDDNDVAPQDEKENQVQGNAHERTPTTESYMTASTRYSSADEGDDSVRNPPRVG